MPNCIALFVFVVVVVWVLPPVVAVHPANGLEVADDESQETNVTVVD